MRCLVVEILLPTISGLVKRPAVNPDTATPACPVYHSPRFDFLAIIAFSTLLYAIGYLVETPEQRFGGAFLHWG